MLPGGGVRDSGQISVHATKKNGRPRIIRPIYTVLFLVWCSPKESNNIFNAASADLPTYVRSSMGNKMRHY